jgi:hypothetical protein
MKIKIIRRKLPTSKGIQEFATPKSDLLEYAPKFRLSYERGDIASISSSIRLDTGGSWMPSANYWYTEQCQIDAMNFAVYKEDSFLFEDVIAWNYKNLEKTKRVANEMKKNGVSSFKERYVLIYYETRHVSKNDIINNADRLMKDEYQHISMPLYNYALVVDKNDNWRLYARKHWLMSFDTGRKLINIINMMMPKFKEIYHFSP